MLATIAMPMVDWPNDDTYDQLTYVPDLHHGVNDVKRDE